MKNNTIEELKEFLKGLYMGIHIYDHYIDKCDDADVRRILQKIQQEHKFNAMRVAERIQNEGAIPPPAEGFLSSALAWMSQNTIPDDTKGILKEAIQAEEKYAVQQAGLHIKGDIDDDYKKLIDDILECNQRHVDMLKKASK